MARKAATPTGSAMACGSTGQTSRGTRGARELFRQMESSAGKTAWQLRRGRREWLYGRFGVRMSSWGDDLKKKEVRSSRVPWVASLGSQPALTWTSFSRRKGRLVISTICAANFPVKLG